MSCIFCRIACGELPSAQVLETDQAIAFLDINPVNLGHLLLIPKAHHGTLADLPDDLSAHLGSLLPRLCRAVKATAEVENLNVIANSGAVAGQTVDHVHWHVIPRFPGDAVRWPWPHVAYGANDLNRLRERVIAAL
jgi:histidine triad (HIT) family protein